ncbi:MAG TPA: tetratricopeptide repeat protein [Candidatus Paceibacterota bacterium]
MEKETSERVSVGILEKISLWIFLALVFFLPFFFLKSVAFQLSKSLFIAITVITMLIVWSAWKLKEGKISYFNTITTWGALAVIVSTVLSTFFSDSIARSFIGQGFEIGTLSAVIISFALLFLIPLTVKNEARIFYFYATFIASLIVFALYHMVRLFAGPDVLSFGLFGNAAASTLGKWNDVGLFFGAGAIMGLFAVEFLSFSPLVKFISWVTLIVSLFFLALINFTAVWIVIGLIAIVSFIYGAWFRKVAKPKSETSGKKFVQKISFVSLAVVILAIIFALGRNGVGMRLSDSFDVAQLEVRPNWSSTLHIVKAALKEDPIFGVGPNRFVNTWLLNKPVEVNETLFWSTDFNSGVGTIPTFIAQTGILGILAWLLFLGGYLYIGIRGILSTPKSALARYFTASSFLVSLYLWVFNVIYVPSHVMHILTFVFTGVFLAALANEKMLAVKDVEYSKVPRLNFAAVLVLVLLLIGSASLGYLYMQKYLSTSYISKGIKILNSSGDLALAERSIVKGINISLREDEFYRIYSQLAILKLRNLLNEQNISQDDLRSRFQGILTDALNAGQRAVRVDPKAYQNWTALAQIYEVLVPLNIDGAYDNAKSAYESALKLNPQSPSLYLLLARLEVTKGNTTTARTYINKALALKSNYTEAVFFLSQLEVAANNMKAAIIQSEKAVKLAPNDATLLFQLGFLKYSDKDYTSAITSLNQAVAQNSSYSNARYFLGLSLYKMNQTNEAIAQFVEIEKLNTDNQEVKLILSNLRAGRDLFANSRAATDAPEKRKNLPVDESVEAEESSVAE